MTEYGDHRDGPPPSADPVWGPPTGSPYLGAPPPGLAGPDDDDTPPRRRSRTWARAALVIGAAAVGFAVAVPTATILRDSDTGPVSAPIAPQVSIAPQTEDGAALSELLAGWSTSTPGWPTRTVAPPGPGWSSPATVRC